MKSLILLLTFSFAFIRASSTPSDNARQFFQANNAVFKELSGGYITYKKLCQLAPTSKAFNQMRLVNHMPTSAEAWVTFFYETIDKLALKKGLKKDGEATDKAVIRTLMHKLSCSDKPLRHIENIIDGYFSAAFSEGTQFVHKEYDAPFSIYQPVRILLVQLSELSRQRIALKHKIEIAHDGTNADKESLSCSEKQMREIVQEMLPNLRLLQPYAFPLAMVLHLADSHSINLPLIPHRIPDHPDLDSLDVAQLFDDRNIECGSLSLMMQHEALALLPVVRTELSIHRKNEYYDGVAMKIIDSIVRPLSKNAFHIPQNEPITEKLLAYDWQIIDLFKQKIALYRYFLDGKTSKLLQKIDQELIDGLSETLDELKGFLVTRISRYVISMGSADRPSIFKHVANLLHEQSKLDPGGEEDIYYAMALNYYRATAVVHPPPAQRAYLDVAYAYIQRCIKYAEARETMEEHYLDLRKTIENGYALAVEPPETIDLPPHFELPTNYETDAYFGLDELKS